jgi:hypothetical protein
MTWTSEASANRVTKEFIIIMHCDFLVGLCSPPNHKIVLDFSIAETKESGIDIAWNKR